MSYHNAQRWGDEDDDENPMGRATLKRHSESIVNNQQCGLSLYPQPACLGLSNANPNRAAKQSGWNLTPEMMNQKWGAGTPNRTANFVAAVTAPNSVSRRNCQLRQPLTWLPPCIRHAGTVLRVMENDGQTGRRR